MKRLVFALWVTAAVAVFTGCGPTIGDPCTTAKDCGGAVCLTRDFTPQGACSTACQVGTASSCPSGSACINDVLGPGAPGCLRTCTAQADCRSGYVCKTVDSAKPTVCIGPQGI